MKTAFEGKVVLNGEEYIVSKEDSYGYADKNWGRDFTSPWVWLASSDLTSKTTGEKLKVDLNQFIEKNYPESFALAGDICKELGKDLNHEFLDNETGYLAIHIEQIKCDEMISE